MGRYYNVYTNDYLEHGDHANHKYTSKVFKNGRWQYFYGQVSGAVNNAKKAVSKFIDDNTTTTITTTNAMTGSQKSVTRNKDGKIVKSKATNVKYKKNLLRSLKNKLNNAFTTESTNTVYSNGKKVSETKTVNGKKVKPNTQEHKPITLGLIKESNNSNTGYSKPTSRYLQELQRSVNEQAAKQKKKKKKN